MEDAAILLGVIIVILKAEGLRWVDGFSHVVFFENYFV